MYTIEQLSRYAYFQNELEDGGDLAFMLDPLTGLVSRQYMLGFVRWLIEQGTPFTFGMLDLDNFKFVNDLYGHHVGDMVLADTAEKLAAFMDGCGIAGRFGGDEYLFIDLVHLTYDEKKAFINEMYTGERCMRRNIRLQDCDPFITGTVGCATYPADAKDYDGLFELIDKTLYRGKNKGRNCYIIYVEEKHAHIQIHQIARHGVYTSMRGLVRQFEMVPGLKNRLHSVTPLLLEELRISDLYYVGKKGLLRSVRNPKLAGDASDIDRLMIDDMFYANDLSRVAARAPVFHATLKGMEIESLMVVRVSLDNLGTDGYLICAEPHNRRIWQEDEQAVMYFLAKLIACRICIDGEALDGE